MCGFKNSSMCWAIIDYPRVLSKCHITPRPTTTIHAEELINSVQPGFILDTNLQVYYAARLMTKHLPRNGPNQSYGVDNTAA